eukprot:scaffold7378_cov410-Prasinococcus_capsulatus_cf.AAC.2
MVSMARALSLASSPMEMVPRRAKEAATSAPCTRRYTGVRWSPSSSASLFDRRLLPSSAARRSSDASAGAWSRLSSEKETSRMRVGMEVEGSRASALASVSSAEGVNSKPACAAAPSATRASMGIAPNRASAARSMGAPPAPPLPRRRSPHAAGPPRPRPPQRRRWARAPLAPAAARVAAALRPGSGPGRTPAAPRHRWGGAPRSAGAAAPWSAQTVPRSPAQGRRALAPTRTAAPPPPPAPRTHRTGATAFPVRRWRPRRS